MDSSKNEASSLPLACCLPFFPPEKVQNRPLFLTIPFSDDIPPSSLNEIVIKTPLLLFYDDEAAPQKCASGYPGRALFRFYVDSGFFG